MDSLPLASLFDVCCFLVLWFIMKYNNMDLSLFFQTGWFAFGIISQTLIIHMMRTNKFPFIQSRCSKELLISTFSVTAAVLVLCFTPLAHLFSLAMLPTVYMLWILLLLLLYATTITVYKTLYVKKYGSML